MSLTEFGKTATKLTHNPLGIIALFIVLVYAFASLVVGFGASLEPSQKTPLIWFLVLFPVLVLIIFAWLVSQHHMKLYAPTDYRDEKLFIYPISPEEQRLRLLAEADVIEAQEPDTTNDGERPREKAVPETPVRDQERVSTVPPARRSAVSKYLVAEDLALRQLEAELRQPIAKQVEVLTGNTRIVFDGLIQNHQEITGIEVKFISRPNASIDMIRSALFRFVDLYSRVKLTDKDTSFKFILVLVTDFSGEELERFKTRIVEHISDVVPLEWRFYSFADLKRRFGVVAESD